MAPRVPLTSTTPGPLGIPDTSGLCPDLSPARRRWHRAVTEQRAVDPVTQEVVRLRNARRQDCHL